MHSLGCAKLIPGDDIVIIGGGVMGLLHIMGAHLFGVRTILSEPDQNRRTFAGKIGANFIINPLTEDAVMRVKQISNGRGVEAVINTTAIPAITEQAVKMTGMKGRCIVYSSQHPDKPVNVNPGWLHNSEVILTGAVNPTITSFDQAVNLISKGILDPSILVTEMIDYTHASDAFERASRPDTYRIVITF
jgi:L-iditol 2-dehydrogenase